MSCYVVDANTVVSAALSASGIPRRSIELARATGTIVLSDSVYAEVAEVLARPKFSAVIAETTRDEIMELLSAAAMWFEPQELVSDCRDVKDNRYLELALAANATTIISGDVDLLVLHPWRGVEIVRPADFILRAATK